MPEITFSEILPEEERQYYSLLNDYDKQILEEEYPRVQLKNGVLLFIPEDVYWMAKTMYFEAGATYAKEGRKYVGWVVRNRQEAPKWGTTYKDVVAELGEFSPNISKGKDFLIKEVGKNEGEWNAWLDCVREATKVNAAPDFDNPIPGATNFYSPVSMKPPYSIPSWASEMEEVEIGGVDTKYFRFFKCNLKGVNI